VITVAIIGLALAALTACGSPEADDDGVASLAGATPASGTGATPTPTTTVNEEDRAFAFAACMRENGVDMADPEINADGGIRMQLGGPKGKAVDKKTIEAAQQKCKEFEPFGGKPPKLDPKQIEAMQKMAQCMREHGVDVPDPGEDGLVEIHKESKDGKGTNAAGINPDDPKVEAAIKACQKYMPNRIDLEKGTS
jgi:hypothetical protein